MEKIKVGHLSLKIMETRETPTTSISKRFAGGMISNKFWINHKTENILCTFVFVYTWRSHVATLLKSPIGKHLQQDLKGENCCEEIVKVPKDPAQGSNFQEISKYWTMGNKLLLNSSSSEVGWNKIYGKGTCACFVYRFSKRMGEKRGDLFLKLSGKSGPFSQKWERKGKVGHLFLKVGGKSWICYSIWVTKVDLFLKVEKRGPVFNVGGKSGTCFSKIDRKVGPVYQK